MIISASRRTDIPAFYGDWFIERIKAGSVSVKNPFNSKIVRKVLLNPDAVDCIVFWTKDPGPFMDKLLLLGQYSYYFLFTLTPYDQTLEKNVPPKKELIRTFRKLSGLIGEARVIWRYDPIIYADGINMDYHIKNFEFLARELHRHTTKCIISFLCMYNKCRKKLQGTGARELTEDEMYALSAQIADIAHSYSLEIQACAVKTDLSSVRILRKADLSSVPILRKAGLSSVPILRKAGLSSVPILRKADLSSVRILRKADLSSVPILRKADLSSVPILRKADLSACGIYPGSCIDKALIEKITGKKLETGRDKNQRKECNCYESFDIGQYNTCRHNCLYCYANKGDSTHVLNTAAVPANNTADHLITKNMGAVPLKI
jgi:hypothetical protein